jgi:hypothetical protein
VVERVQGWPLTAISIDVEMEAEHLNKMKWQAETKVPRRRRQGPKLTLQADRSSCN